MPTMEVDSYAAQALDFLRIEAEAILEAADRLDSEEFAKAVSVAAGCTGKILLLGIGTSGFVARKVAATMTSTGTPAIYLHPSDALHGALGVVAPEDVVIVVSKSGESDELLVVLPYLHRRRVPVIAIVGNPDSTLARHARVLLDARVKREACPLNLTPTASTAVALAIGDALALTLMQVKGVTPEEFARNHPSGRLGKRLTLTVRDLMYTGEARPAVSPGAPWLEVVSEISNGGLGAVAVVGRDEALVGIITDGDLRRAVQGTDSHALEALEASRIMTRDPVVVGPDVLAFDALQLMENRPSQIGVLPVVDEERRCIGIIRLHDLVRSGL